MELFKLRYFVAAYECRSYTKAADRLYTTRQALRHGIKSMESELGVELFLTCGRQIEPTPVARRLYEACGDLLDAYASFEERLPDIVTAKSTKVRWGQVTGIHDAYTKSEMESRRGGNYAAWCQFVTGSCDECRRLLAEDRLDVATIITTAPAIGAEDGEECLPFKSRTHRTGRLYLMAHRRSALARKSCVTVDDLRGMPFLTQGAGYDIHGFIIAACRQRGFEPDVSYVAPHFHELVAQVNANLGVSYYLMPRVELYDAPNVVLLPFEEPGAFWRMQGLIGRRRTTDELCYRLWSGLVTPVSLMRTC